MQFEQDPSFSPNEQPLGKSEYSQAISNDAVTAVDSRLDGLNAYKPGLRLVVDNCFTDARLRYEFLDRSKQTPEVYCLSEDLIKFKTEAITADNVNDSTKAWNAYSKLLSKSVERALQEGNIGFASWMVSDSEFYGKKNSRELRYKVDKQVQQQIREAYANGALEQAEEYIDLLTIPFNREKQRKTFESKIYTCLENAVDGNNFQYAYRLLSLIKQQELQLKAQQTYEKGILKRIQVAYDYIATNPDKADDIKVKIKSAYRQLKTDEALAEAKNLFDNYQTKIGQRQIVSVRTY